MSKPIKNNSQLLYLQARQLFEEARSKFDDGSIKSEPKLIGAVFHSFQEFFTSMGKPNLVPRLAPEDGPPWSEDYNSMMSEVRKDLELLFQEVDILGRTLYTDFNHNMIQHEIVNKQFEDVLDKIKDLESYARISGVGIELGRDDFLNKEKIDYSRIAGTPLEIVDGAVTLPQVSRTNVAKNAKVSIIVGNRQSNKFILGTESNGFPGNNTEIHSVTDDVLTNRNYIPTFLGEENNHSDYSDVLDGSPNSWFEYEKVNVREHDKIRVAKNLGWDYQVHENQTIAWAEDPDNGVLKLHMQIILDKEEVINQINCNMFTPANYGAKTAIVKNILVSDGKETPKSVMPLNRSEDQYHFHFPPVKAKLISVLFEQPHKYITDIGHIFYEKKMQVEDSSEYAMEMATKKYKYAPRVEGPLIALEDLGIDVKVSESNIEAAYPLIKSGDDKGSSNIGETINRLMHSVDMETVDMGVEKFEGFRWCIGVRDIEVYSCEYAPEGELVTNPFFFDKPLDKISLNVNENIPPLFTNNDATKYDWLKYFVSIDDGATWYPITPMSHEVISNDQPPKIYTVQTIESSEQKLDDKHAYIESEYPVYSMRMKIVARRPEDFTLEGFSIKDMANDTTGFVQSSPIVNAYIFNVLTVDDVVNSDESDRLSESADDLGSKPNPGESPEPPPAVEEEESHLKVSLDCKRQEWCLDKELIFSGKISSDHELVKVELLINNQLEETKDLTSKSSLFAFSIPANRYSATTTITAVIRGYDTEGSAVDTDVINIVDCIGLPPEDLPQDCKSNQELNIVFDKTVTKLCKCDDVRYYGTVQGPNPIQAVVHRVNGVVIDPYDLGAPPEDNPCTGASEDTGAMQIVEVKAIEDDDLLEIEDFGEWLDAFEEKNDCGCKNKKKDTSQVFEMQSDLFLSYASSSEESFQVTIPYWKLHQIGITPGTDVVIEITAIDSVNNETKESFSFIVEDCENPSTDIHGNPRVRDCYLLESVEVQYYSYTSNSLETEVIPANALPYDGIDNGIGTKVTVGWRSDSKGPIIMQTSGYDESTYSFQIHAVGIHYLNEYDQPGTFWSYMMGDKSSGVKNANKMIGSSSRNNSWISDIQNGNFYTSPSFTKINDYATFIMENDWIVNSCPVLLPDFDPSTHIQPLESTCDIIEGCSSLSHILLQTFDETDKRLDILKFSVKGKDTYDIKTKNGTVSVQVGWDSYFKGPAIKIVSGPGVDNLLFMSVGILYTDRCGVSQTAWSTNVLYNTVGVHYPEFAEGLLKDLSTISWISNGVVDYSQATYVGQASDMVVYSIEEELLNELCPPPVIDTGVTPEPPKVTFFNTVDEICFDEEAITINALAEDSRELKEVHYSMSLNGVDIYGPYVDLTSEQQYTVDFSVDPMTLQIGDVLNLTAKAINLFGLEEEKTHQVSVINCVPPDYEQPEALQIVPRLKITSGVYCYQDLIDGNKFPFDIQATDNVGLKELRISLSSGEGTPYVKAYDPSEYVTDSGVIRAEVPITIPDPVSDGSGGTYIPNKSFAASLRAVDKAGNQSLGTNAQVQINIVDCSKNPPTEPSPCNAQTISGGSGITTRYYNLGTNPGRVTINYNMQSVPDRLDVYYADQIVASTNGDVSNAGSVSFDYMPINDNYEIKIVVKGSTSDTAWDYTVNCPV
jgi:hypothetical protein